MLKPVSTRRKSASRYTALRQQPQKRLLVFES